MNRPAICLTALLATVLLASAASASTSCPAHYANGVAPEILNPRLAMSTREVCFSEYGVMHSGITRTPLWSAEHLTRARLTVAQHMTRVNSFHPEARLPVNERSELADFVRSGMDRGHMAPSGDFATADAQYESFSLANMIPQNPNNNQNLWEGIESAVRTLATKRSELYVVTGPLFKGSLTQLNGRVMVPTQIYKVVYDPRTQEAGAYLVNNEATSEYRVVSIAELESLAGIEFLPKLAPAARQHALALPAPTPHGHQHHSAFRPVYRRATAGARLIHALLH